MAILPAPSGDEEIADRRSDFVAVRLKGKVARVEEPHLGARDVALERLRARWQEERIVLAPNRQKPRLVLAEIGLEFRIEHNVALVVAEEIELRLIGAETGQIEAVKRISVGRNRRRIGDAVGVLPDVASGERKARRAARFSSDGSRQ